LAASRLLGEDGSRAEIETYPAACGRDSGIVIEITPYMHHVQELTAQTADFGIFSGLPVESTIIVSKKLGKAHPLVKQSTEILKNCKPDPIGILRAPGRGCLNIKVSRKSLSRALRIMEALIRALDKRGGSVSISEGSTRVSILDVRLGFGISEQIARKKIEAKELDLDGYYRFGHSRFDEQHHSRDPIRTDDRRHWMRNETRGNLR